MGGITRRTLATRTARLAFIALMLLVVALVVKRWIDRHGTPPPLSELFPNGELVIGVDGSYPPFGVADANGQLSGIDVAVGQALAQQIGVERVRFINMGFDGLYDSLISGQVDVVIAALRIDPFRTADVRYTWAYFNAGLMLVTPADSQIGSMDSLSGRRLAYEYGSEGDAEARRWLRRIPSFETQPYALPDHALDAVRLVQADAAVVEAISARLYLRQYPAWDVQRIQVSDSLFSAAVRYDREWVYKLLNRAMLDLLNNGSIEAILDAYL